MSKKLLMEIMCSEHGMTQKEASNCIDSVVSGIQKALKMKEEVSLIGFGKFESVKSPERKARNPSTGEEIIVPEKNVPKFRPSDKLKEYLNS